MNWRWRKVKHSGSDLASASVTPKEALLLMGTFLRNGCDVASVNGTAICVTDQKFQRHYTNTSHRFISTAMKVEKAAVEARDVVKLFERQLEVQRAHLLSTELP